LLLFIFLFDTIAFAQKKQNIYLLKNDGREVEKIDSADFMRVIQEPAAGSTNFALAEFYPDQSKKLVGHVSAFEPRLIYEGVITSYYKNGNKSKVESYEKGVRLGTSNYYYLNGQLQITLDYAARKSLIDQIQYGEINNYKVVNYFDSTGVQFVKDGNGTVKMMKEKEGNVLDQEGTYLDGVKDGKWSGRIGNDRFEELYSNGTFVSGIATYSDGSVHPYTNLGGPPNYMGGINSFLQYVGAVFTYPKDAIERGIGGRLSVSFIVEKDGTVSEVKTLNSLSRSIDAEAIRVVKRSPKWIPGTMHGIPVRVAYNLPLLLKQ